MQTLGSFDRNFLKFTNKGGTFYSSSLILLNLPFINSTSSLHTLNCHLNLLINILLTTHPLSAPPFVFYPILYASIAVFLTTSVLYKRGGGGQGISTTGRKGVLDASTPVKLGKCTRRERLNTGLVKCTTVCVFRCVII